MEIELKYLIDDEMKADGIWEELKNRPDARIESAEDKLMHAVYFDTADERLSKEKIAVRVRREGDQLVATCKWGGNLRKAVRAVGDSTVTAASGAGEALHARPELNVPVKDDSWFITPPGDMFGDSEIGERIVELLKGEQLIPLLETRFIRRLVQIQVNDMICEAAVDTGRIMAGEKWEPICELELELLEGDGEQLAALGQELKARYGLVAGEKSKFARGKALRGGK